MFSYQECKKKMEEILQQYNKKWLEFIIFIRDESEYKFEYLISISDETKEIIENLSFQSAQWSSYEMSTSKSGAYICCNANNQEYRLRINKKDDMLVGFDFFIGYFDKQQIGEEIIEEYKQIEVLSKKEKVLLRKYMDMFGVVAMCNESDTAWK